MFFFSYFKYAFESTRSIADLLKVVADRILDFLIFGTNQATVYGT